MKGKYDEHYKNLNPQPIEVIENWELDFHLANVLKYISRAGRKEGESELKDLEKAKVYLDRKILKLKDKGYKKGQVWTCANNPKCTLTIRSMLNDGRMIVQVADGKDEWWVYFNEDGKGDEQGFYNFQLTILKRDV